MGVAGEHRWAQQVGADQAAQGGQAVDVGAFVAMGGVAAERQQRGADVMAGGNRRLGIAVVVAKQVATHRNLLVAGQFEQVTREVEIVGPAGILQGHRHRMFMGFLALGCGCDVDADELADVPRQGTSGTRTGFLGDGEQRMAVDRRLLAAFEHHL